MNRRVLVSTVALCTALLPLSGCQAAVEHFGPQPNDALLALADAAQHDAVSLRTSTDDSAAQAAKLRAQQADELYAEIARLCGLREDGTPPESCEVVPGEAAQEEVALIHNKMSVIE
ncbi:MAG: hypothetical protein Q4E25_07525, partial [Corynebacterium sp.]|nr:hypothetical protein [Corynebacterium sp.]